eukprot:RCo050269
MTTSKEQHAVLVAEVQLLEEEMARTQIHLLARKQGLAQAEEEMLELRARVEGYRQVLGLQESPVELTVPEICDPSAPPPELPEACGDTRRGGGVEEYNLRVLLHRLAERKRSLCCRRREQSQVEARMYSVVEGLRRLKAEEERLLQAVQLQG